MLDLNVFTLYRTVKTKRNENYSLKQIDILLNLCSDEDTRAEVFIGDGGLLKFFFHTRNINKPLFLLSKINDECIFSDEVFTLSLGMKRKVFGKDWVTSMVTDIFQMIIIPRDFYFLQILLCLF